MIWLIALLFVWMAFEVRSDPGRRESQNFKIIPGLRVGAIVCCGGRSAAMTFAAIESHSRTKESIGLFTSSFEAIAWICLAAEIFLVFTKPDPGADEGE